MKIPLLFFGILFYAITVSAQSISPDVIAADGDFFYTAFGSVSYTEGEVMVETFSNSSIALTQGFQQPWKLYLANINELAKGNGMVIYPNPAQSSFTISFNDLQIESWHLKIADATGRVLYEGENKNQKLAFRNSFASGVYFIQATVGEKVYMQKLVIN